MFFLDLDFIIHSGREQKKEDWKVRIGKSFTKMMTFQMVFKELAGFRLAQIRNRPIQEEGNNVS